MNARSFNRACETSSNLQRRPLMLVDASNVAGIRVAGAAAPFLELGVRARSRRTD